MVTSDKLARDPPYYLLPKFDVFLKIQRGVSVSTFQHHKYNLLKIFNKIERFDYDNCCGFLINLKEDKLPGTVQNYIYTIRVFCEFLAREGIIEYNFGKDIPLPKRDKTLPVVLSVKEIEKVLDTDLPNSYARYPRPQEAKYIFDTILSLLSKTGARVGEVLGIKIGDISWDEGVWKLDYTKTRRGRLIPLPPDDLRKMRRLVKVRAPDERLFINPWSGNPVTNHNLGENFRRRIKKAQINKKATVHTLRHSFITELLRQDVSVLKIANIAGHEQITTTQEYAKLLYEDLRDAIMRHPMTAKNRNPYDILKHIKETVNKFHLKEDSRFFYEINDMTDGIKINIFVR